jgi:SWI/SNF-related matrix-associated actin-dependent regulator of chromatin subfamily A3
MIRNQSTKIFRAITSLLGKIRWCLTGTPIQNKLEDLAALVRFLQVPSLLNPREFKRYCIEPVERKGADGFANIRALLQIICIRRTQGLLKLPEHETIEHKLELSDTERLQYSKVTEDYKAAIEEAICGRKTADAYTSILKALLDLRRICNYGTSILTPTLPDGEEPQISSPEALTYCVYCGMKISTQGLEEDLPAVRLPACTHLSCFSCLEMYLADMEKSANCPTCLKLLQNRTPTPQQQIVKSPIPSGRDKYVSTKFKKLLEDVQAHMKSDKW